MAQEDLIEEEYSGEIGDDTKELLADLRGKNKEIGKLYKKQKQNYDQLLAAIEDKQPMNDVRQTIKETRIEIITNIQQLQQMEMLVDQHCKDTRLDGMFLITRRRNVDIPTRRLPNGNYVYICSSCNFEKTSKSGIENHMHEEHGLSQVDCPLCEFATSSTQLLSGHCKNVHEINITFQLIL